MKCLPNIEFSEDFSLANSSERFVYQGQWISILSSNCVQFPKIDTESKAAGRFFHEEDRRRVRCLTRLYKALIEIIEKVPLSYE